MLAPMEPVVITARDGFELVSYLTLPVGVEAKNLPLVLNVHGGPWARDGWGYDPEAQWFANRGYATLQVNFRGSAGFGKKFLNAGNGQWGVGTMQHDLTDAVKWAIAKGIADPKKVCIYGGSYGGYATLAGLVFTPDLYACGVDIVGPSNIKTLLAAIPPYWAPMKKMFTLRVGDVEADETLNTKISPLFHASNIKVPLIVAQGANDPRVNIREADQIVKAMRDKGLPVTYVVYTDEGHGFARPNNRLDFYGRVDEFLAKHLGGRAEPWTQIEGTSADVR
jgi:dipeptidyl aminopeptidase/acylaminoacyl peptidase